MLMAVCHQHVGLNPSHDSFVLGKDTDYIIMIIA